MASKKDFIVLNSSNKELVVHLIKEYFELSVSNSETDITLYENNTGGQLLILFNSKPNNMEFVFFFEFLSTEAEFQQDNYSAWFGLSDAIYEGSDHKEFDAKTENDTFARRVFLTTEMTADYVVGFSDQGERIEFQHSGNYAITQHNGFTHSQVNHDLFKPLETFHFSAKKPKSSLGCLGVFSVILLALALAFTTI